MKKAKVRYQDMLDIYRIYDEYHTIRLNTKHKSKLVQYEMFLSCNIISIYETLKLKKYQHQNYNIFLIKEPKYRIIMSEKLSDKIVNHLVADYILYPMIEPRLINENVATRKNKGTKSGIYYVKKYINQIKLEHEEFYILKCDIKKYFYNINHDILIDKLKKILDDPDALKIVETIINSTDQEYVNQMIKKAIDDEKIKIHNSGKNKDLLSSLENIPYYKKGKGLPIGNMTSQLLAIFYLNDLDHFIKEKLKIKRYTRYMDDLVLIHEDKNYLKHCLKEIEKFLEKEDLYLNNKTQIYKSSKGFTFLGYKFVMKNKKLILLINNKTKRRINKKLKYMLKNNSPNITSVKASYNGYLKYANSGSLKNKLGL